ncbi:MAG: photosystem II protein PsbQ [Thermosynechococcaceae cyanobacterium]
MFRFRALLSGLFALVAFVLVSCGGPGAVSVPPTYTETQLQQIQQYLPEIQNAYDKLDALNAAIESGNWQEIRSTIRGPFGSMIQDLNYVTSHLLPSDQKAARASSRQVFEDFIAIDRAAVEKDAVAASRSFDEAVRDLETFMSRLPEIPVAAASEEAVSVDELLDELKEVEEATTEGAA